MKIGMKQRIASTTIFVGILVGLMSVDDRVQDRFSTFLYSGGATSWSHRLSELGEALFDAVRHQSIENAPLVVFAAVSAVLVLFMWRT